MPSVSFLSKANKRDASEPAQTPAKKKQPLASALKQSKPTPPMPSPSPAQPKSHVPPLGPARSKVPGTQLANAQPASRDPLSSIQVEVGSGYSDPTLDARIAYDPRNLPSVRFDLSSPPPEPSRPGRTPENVTKTARSDSPRPRTASSASRTRQASPVNGAPARRAVGPFRLLRELNSGTYGSVYAAHDSGSGRLMCMRVTEKKKMLAKGGALLSGLLTEVLCHKIIASSSPKDRARFLELHGILQDERRVVFAMPLMNCDLLAVIRGRCDRSLTRRWIAQLALGIDALHRMGIIHRDIKPENVLLDAPDGNVRIADFNTAFVSPWNAPLEDGAVYAKELTGSMPYMAWEVTKRRWYGKMVDWWALGCVMYDLVTGTVLFKNDIERAEYVKWDRKAEGKSFVARADKGRMSGEEESVISGLISVYPGARFQLRHLRHHAYFLDEHRVNVFDSLLREAPVDLLTVGRSARAGDLEVEGRLKDTPPLHATPLVYTGDPRGEYDFNSFAWANPHGLWRP